MDETTARTEPQPFGGEDWFDPLEGAVRGRIRGFIEEMLEAELETALQRRRYERIAGRIRNLSDRLRARVRYHPNRDQIPSGGVVSVCGNGRDLGARNIFRGLVRDKGDGSLGIHNQACRNGEKSNGATHWSNSPFSTI